MCVYAIIKTMCPLHYHHNGFVATHALIGHMMYGYICKFVIYIKFALLLRVSIKVQLHLP